MAFTPRTVEYADSASTTSLTVNVPAGTVDGDLLLLWIGLNNASSYIPNSGYGDWFEAGEYYTNTDKYVLFYKTAHSEPASYTIGFSGTTKARGAMICYTGGDFLDTDGGQVDAVSNTAYRTSNGTCRAATLNTSATDEYLVGFFATYSTTSKTFTKPANIGSDVWSEDDDAGSTGSGFWLEICSILKTAAGAAGNMDATISATQTTKHAIVLALNPPIPSVDITIPTNTVTLSSNTGAGLTIVVTVPINQLHLSGSAILVREFYAAFDLKVPTPKFNIESDINKILTIGFKVPTLKFSIQSSTSYSSKIRFIVPTHFVGTESARSNTIETNFIVPTPLFVIESLTSRLVTVGFVVPTHQFTTYAILKPTDLTYKGVVMNTMNGAHTEYSGLNLDSAVYFNGKYYLASSTGLVYENALNDSVINFHLKTGDIDSYIGTRRMPSGVKRFFDIYLSYTTDGKILMNLKGDKDGSYQYIVTEERVPPGKGFNSRFYSFELVNSTSKVFSMEHAHLLGNLIDRRIR